MSKPTFPEVFEKVTFLGVPTHYYPHFLDMGERAMDQLVIGQEYEVARVRANPSWTQLWLKEIGVEDGQSFNLSFFREQPTTSEICDLIFSRKKKEGDFLGYSDWNSRYVKMAGLILDEIANEKT